MTRKDLIKGRYYYHKYLGEYIYLFNGFSEHDVNDTQAIELTDKRYISNYRNDINDSERLATLQEITHLKACIKAKKYVIPPISVKEQFKTYI